MGQASLTTEQKQEAVDAVAKYGSQNEAARQLGLNRATFCHRYRAGIKAGLDEAIVHPAPQGHTVKGVSTFYRGDGSIAAQWVKTKAGEQDTEELAERIRQVYEGMTPAAVVPAPSHSNADLLTVYPIPDAHIGMRAYKAVTGSDYNTQIATDRLRNWIGRLVASSPPSGEAIILDVGDLTHMDDHTNQTPKSKHNLDVDGGIFHVVDMTIEALSCAIELALVKHQIVRVVIIKGNHNPNAYIAILFAIAERYRCNPRVIVRKSEREMWVHQFGKCLLAAHHGDKAKPERLVMNLADEFAALWGDTVHRILWTAHLHHLKSADIGGVLWEQLRAMTDRDEYAFTHAYVARAQLQAITLHRTAGEVQRQAVSSYEIE